MQFFKRKHKTTGVLAIQPFGKNLYFAHVEMGDEGKPKVRAAMIRSEVIDASGISGLVKDFSGVCKHVSILLTKNDYQLLQLEDPGVPEAETREAVAWKIKDLISYPVEQAIVDVINIPQADTRRQKSLYVAAANSSLVAGRMRLFKGLNVEFVDIPELAQRNLANQLEREGRGIVMLSISGNDGLLTFTANGELCYVRSIEVDIAKMNKSGSEEQAYAYERLSLEVQRSLDNFERQFPSIPISRMVLAPFVNRHEFHAHLKPFVDIQLDLIDLSEIFEFSDNVKLGDLGMQAQLLPVLGAALREINP